MITASRMLQYLFFAIALLAGLVLLFINRNLASLAELVYPGSLLWAHASLLALEVVACFWFWRGVFGGRKHLLHADDESAESREAFAKELVHRLQSNAYVREANLVPSGPEDTGRLEQCLELLNKKADAEIEQNARRVFLATALSQNGKLDALIVFIALCRLIWRISTIYNQRPHPREILSLYWAVVTTTFLALSLEELDVTTEIGVGFGQALHAMAPAGITAGIPFAGKALQTVTVAAIDGTANCYLVLRAGIITRNAYAYAFADKRPSRAAVFREAGGILLAMSTSLMDKLGVGVADALTGAVRSAQDKTVRASKGFVKSIGAGLRIRPRETE